MQPQGFAQQSRGPAGFMDLSAASLPSTMPQTAGQAGVQIQFFYAPVHLRNEDPTFNNKVITRLCIKKRPISDRKTCSVEFITEEEAMRQYPREFAMFQEYGEVPMDGTPLADVPGLSRADVSQLNALGLRSAEDVAAMSEDMAAQNGRAVIRAWKVVSAWIKVNTDNRAMVEMAERDAARDAELKAMQDQNQSLVEQMKALQAKIEAMQSVSGQYPPQMPQGQIAQAGQGNQQTFVADDTENLPTSLADMPNPWAEGADTGDATLADEDDDPLRDEPSPGADGVVR